MFTTRENGKALSFKFIASRVANTNYNSEGCRHPSVYRSINFLKNIFSEYGQLSAAAVTDDFQVKNSASAGAVVRTREKVVVGGIKMIIDEGDCGIINALNTCIFFA